MKKVLSLFKVYFIISLGTVINAIGWTAFIIPHKVVGGGLSGLSALINFSTGFPIGLGYLIMNFFMIILAIKFIGAQFGLKTIYGILSSSLMISIFENVFKEPVVHDEFMAIILGGALIGAGLGVVFSQGATTGGTDIIVSIIMKYKDISPGKLLLLIDIIIISSSYLIFGSIEKIIYGVVSMAVASYALDILLEGNKQSVHYFIFSEKYEKIAQRITCDLSRGVTLLKGIGWYTKSEKNVLMVIVRKNEMPFVMKIIHEEDPKAFVSLGNVMGIYGKGFETIRAKK